MIFSFSFKKEHDNKCRETVSISGRPRNKRGIRSARDLLDDQRARAANDLVLATRREEEEYSRSQRSISYPCG